MTRYAVELLGIDKRFGPVHANRSVTLRVPKGTVHGIIGENGAGKSTLMSILYGLLEPDQGRILIDGAEAEIRRPGDAIARGLGMVHQHFMLVDAFTVLENLVLGAESGPLLAPALVAARARASELAGRFGIELPFDAVVGELPVGVRQRIEILKALYRGAEILILDEPTAVLIPQEVAELARLIAELKNQGRTILLITHKLKEVMAITDSVTVLRQGAVAAEFRTAETSESGLAEAMIGRRMAPPTRRPTTGTGEAALVVEKLGVIDEAGVHRLADISFTLKAGEIVGIAGVSGNGQTELLEVLSGLRPPSSGSFRVGAAAPVSATSPCDPAQLHALGLAHIPEDRLQHGVVKDFSAAENAILGRHKEPALRRGPWLSQERILARAASLMERFDVRPRAPEQRIGRFSGGNQQKLVVGRELDRRPRVLLVGQPTRGVDIGAIEFIHQRLFEARDQGAAILLVSSELEEIQTVADRILVLSGGRLTGEVAGDEASEVTLGRLMGGVAA